MNEFKELEFKIYELEDDRFALTEKLRKESMSLSFNEVVDLKKEIQQIDDTVNEVQELLNKKDK